MKVKKLKDWVGAGMVWQDAHLRVQNLIKCVQPYKTLYYFVNKIARNYLEKWKL